MVDCDLNDINESIDTYYMSLTFDNDIYAELRNELNIESVKYVFETAVKHMNEILRLTRIFNIDDKSVVFSKSGDHIKAEIQIDERYFTKNPKLFTSTKAINKFNI